MDEGGDSVRSLQASANAESARGRVGSCFSGQRGIVSVSSIGGSNRSWAREETQLHARARRARILPALASPCCLFTPRAKRPHHVRGEQREAAPEAKSCRKRPGGSPKVLGREQGKHSERAGDDEEKDKVEQTTVVGPAASKMLDPSEREERDDGSKPAGGDVANVEVGRDERADGGREAYDGGHREDGQRQSGAGQVREGSGGDQQTDERHDARRNPGRREDAPPFVAADGERPTARAKGDEPVEICTDKGVVRHVEEVPVRLPDRQHKGRNIGRHQQHGEQKGNASRAPLGPGSSLGSKPRRQLDETAAGKLRGGRFAVRMVRAQRVVRLDAVRKGILQNVRSGREMTQRCGEETWRRTRARDRGRGNGGGGRKRSAAVPNAPQARERGALPKS